MILLKRKTRILSIRLSEEEYASLLEASLHHGARSVSDYARDTLFRCLEGDEVSTRVNQLASQLDIVTRDLESLRATLVK
jgi:hypothetical protein